MKTTLRSLAQEYLKTLEGYLAGGGEPSLQQGYELGRRAINSGMGVLDLAHIHESTLKMVLLKACSPEETTQTAKAAEAFFAESLAPFEMAQRGFKEANVALRQLNATLEERVIERTRQLREKDKDILRAYVDVFCAVTGGRLVIMKIEEIEAALGKPIGEERTISAYRDISGVREELSGVVEREFPFLDLNQLTVAVCEAATNAVKHAGGGRVQIFGQDSTIQIAISDSGPGIDFSILPKATLTAGFSTTKTLGLGFSVMLEFCDRVLLSTEPGKTTIVLETGKKGVDGRN